MNSTKNYMLSDKAVETQQDTQTLSEPSPNEQNEQLECLLESNQPGTETVAGKTQVPVVLYPIVHITLIH